MADKNKQSKTKWELIGAVAAAIGASVCCLGPLVLVGLGFSGAWIGNLSGFNRYRPFFMFLAFILLGIAFYKVYFRSKKKRCEPDSYCVHPKAEKINKIALWGVMFLSVGMLVLPGLFGMLTTKPSIPIQSALIKQVVFSVEGMTCGGCALTIEKSLEDLDGVDTFSVTFDPPEAIVNYNSKDISIEAIMGTITDLGYLPTLKGGN